MRDPLEVQKLKRHVLRTAIALLLLVMATTLAGCGFGPPKLVVSFVPSTLELQPNQQIDLTIRVRLDGWGFFSVNEVRLEYLDSEGQEIDDAGEWGMPTGQVLDEPIQLAGTLGLLSAERTLTQLNNDEPIEADPDWWLIPSRPTTIVFMFLDGSEKLVGSSELGLEWFNI